MILLYQTIKLISFCYYLFHYVHIQWTRWYFYFNGFNVIFISIGAILTKLQANNIIYFICCRKYQYRVHQIHFFWRKKTDFSANAFIGWFINILHHLGYFLNSDGIKIMQHHQLSVVLFAGNFKCQVGYLVDLGECI